MRVNETDESMFVFKFI